MTINRVQLDISSDIFDKFISFLEILPSNKIKLIKKDTIYIDNENSLNDDKWSYWRDEEIDNFGKIAIGLSKNNYDDEDYSQW